MFMNGIFPSPDGPMSHEFASLHRQVNAAQSLTTKSPAWYAWYTLI